MNHIVSTVYHNMTQSYTNIGDKFSAVYTGT